MLNRKLLIVAVAMAGTLLGVETPASAQVTATQSQDPADRAAATTADGRNARRGLTGFVAQSGARRRNRQAAAATPEETRAAAQAVVAAAGLSCQVTEATYLGDTDQQQKAYEAACASGPGFIVIGSTPPQTIDCVVLATQGGGSGRGTANATPAAAAAPAAGQAAAAAPGITCQLAANKNLLAVFTAYGAEAGIPCTIDEGAAVGQSSTTQAVIYEIGCANTDGYWLERTGTTWKKTPCFQVVSSNGRCRFTTPAEQAGVLKTWLAGSTAAACDVSEARYMGANANGAFYEAKCASGEGYIARLNNENAVQQVYPCAEAARIGGGCKLTTVAAAPAAAPATQP